MSVAMTSCPMNTLIVPLILFYFFPLLYDNMGSLSDATKLEMLIARTDMRVGGSAEPSAPGYLGSPQDGHSASKLVSLPHREMCSGSSSDMLKENI